MIGALALGLLLVGVVGCAVWSGRWAKRQLAQLEAEWQQARAGVIVEAAEEFSGADLPWRKDPLGVDDDPVSTPLHCRTIVR